MDAAAQKAQQTKDQAANKVRIALCLHGAWALWQSTGGWAWLVLCNDSLACHDPDVQSACAFPPTSVQNSCTEQSQHICRPSLCCYFVSYILQAQAGYDSAKGAASDAASTAQDKASQYAEAGQEQVSLRCITDVSPSLILLVTCAVTRFACVAF
jgi:hypothetical protein